MKEVQAAEELLKPQPKEVPPQLLLALEKDGRCLARGFEAAIALSEGIMQGLRDHRDSYKVIETEQIKPFSEMSFWIQKKPSPLVDICSSQKRARE